MNKLQMLLTIGTACLLFLVVACFQAGEEDALFTEPCVPLPGSDVDPCERQPHWSVRTSASFSIDEDRMPKLPYVLLNEIRGHAAHVPYGLMTPQFWVRGTFVPGSSRCALQRAFAGVNKYGEVEAYNFEVEAPMYPEFDCFIDVKVHEYLNGDGPDRLPILVLTGWTDKMDADDDYVARFANGRLLSSLEGREFVFYVVRPNDITTGAWDRTSFLEFWDVQRREDGEVVVVAGWADIDDRFDYEFTLDEFSADIRTAMAAFVEGTGGRVNDDPNEYMLAKDANLGSLLENLRTYGAYSVADITPVVAPPVPGETDPDPYGLTVSDTPVTASPEVPGGLEDTPTPVLEMLNVAIPPCVPYPGSDVDPCERRDTWPQLNPYVSVSYEYPQPVPTLEELYLSIIDTEQYNSAPQFVVRAIPIPGSTRCGTFGSFGSEFTAFSGNREGASDHTRCWVDLAVNEYIINSGPARLTIDIGVWIPNLDREGLANDARVFGERFEGWEWVITLNGPIDPNNASWRMRWHQDVQMREDGSVVVVSWSKKDYMLISPPEFRSINLQRLETTLPEYRRIAKSAYEKFFERTGGRIMVGNDINGNPLPHLAKDASDDSIRKYIGEIKVVDASQYTLNWPPPVPGEGDPNPDGLRINDIIATRVAGGVRIPGGPEDTPTPVSALGDEPTATTTAPKPESEESDE